MTPADIIAFFNLTFIIKLALLVLMGLYSLFALFLLIQVRSLNHTLHVESSHASAIMIALTILHLLASLSLFGYILAIL